MDMYMLVERPHWVTDAVAADGSDLCSLLAFKTNANLTGRRGAAPMDRDPQQHFWSYGDPQTSLKRT